MIVYYLIFNLIDLIGGLDMTTCHDYEINLRHRNEPFFDQAPPRSKLRQSLSKLMRPEFFPLLPPNANQNKYIGHRLYDFKTFFSACCFLVVSKKVEKSQITICIWYLELVGGILSKNVYPQVINSYSREAE